MTDDDELHIGDYLDILRRRWLIIALVVVLVVGAAVGLSARTDPQYRATASVLVRPSAAQDRLDPANSGRWDFERELQNEVQFAQSDGVYEAATDALGYAPSVSVSPASDSDILYVSATSGEPELAAEQANVYAETLVEERSRTTANELLAATSTLNERIAEIGDERDEILAEIDAGADERRFTGQLDALDAEEASLRASLREIEIAEDLATGGSARVISAAGVPGAPFEPAWERNIALALVVGLVLGVGAALLRETLDGTIRNKAQIDAASGLPALGLLPAPPSRRRDSRPTLVTSRSGAFAETIRSLRSSIMFVKADHPEVVAVAFVSPNPAEGKTTTVVNLALAMARSGQQVVVVDADLRRPRAAEACGINSHAPGITEILAGRTSLVTFPEQVTGDELFQVMAPGMDVADPAEVLASPGFDQLVDDLRRKYDIVLLDTAPVLPVSDGLSVAAAADATVVVAQAEQTMAKQLGAALELLARADANVIGTVLTNVDDRREYGGAGYGYGSNKRD